MNLEDETKKGITTILILAIGFIALLGLFGKSGLMGDFSSDTMLWAFGWGRWLVPFIFLLWGYAMYDDERFELRLSTYFGWGLLVLSLHLFFSLLVDVNTWDVAVLSGRGGGHVGYFLAGSSIKLMGFLASFFVSLGLVLASLLIIFDTSLKNMIGPDTFIGKVFYPFHFVLAKIFGSRRKDDEEGEGEHEENDNEEEVEEEENNEDEESEDENDDEEGEEENDDEGNDDEGGGEDEHEEEEVDEEADEEEAPYFPPRKAEVSQAEPIWWQKPNGVKIDIPLSLLLAKKDKPTSGDIDKNKEIIFRTLKNFGIDVEMGAVSVGPTVTQYTFRPADGVKLAKITNLSNDLALALAAHPIRIEAPIPGKPLVGVEVPNHTKAMVGLREILSSKPYKERKSNSMLALGKDVAGKSWLADITKMPHLLVAGATNSGKSVCLNTIIISLLYQNNPDDIRFIMVDPKRVELTPYKDSPYLLTPVITDINKTVNALKWCLNEMDRRYEELGACGNKNIQTYNETHGIKMPYIVFIIDELADLMVANTKEIEGSIIRLAQMARAVGIHLILATQRPSVDVITGLIKANMPARIAFSVASGTDSRTILDSLGAEKLLGKGDMLFFHAELSKPVRLQGAYLSEDEINKINKYVKAKGKGVKQEEGITERQKVAGVAGVGLDGTTGNEDELLAEARDTVVNMGKASASFLQRKMRIGYARAASILDQLEELGIIGPSNGAKPREILISKQQLAAYEKQGVSGVPVHDPKDFTVPDNYLGEESEMPPVLKKSKFDLEDEEENDDEEEEEDDNDDDKEENEEPENNKKKNIVLDDDDDMFFAK